MKWNIKDKLNLKKQHISVEIIKHWKHLEQIYFTSGVLVKVNQGQGALREVYGEIGKQTYLTLMLGKQPLLQLQGNDYFCPTCEKIMKSGYGMEQASLFQLNKINQDKEKVSFLEAIEEITPLLGLLRSGYYVVVDMKLCPTDGNGHLFWELPNDCKYLPGTCIYYYGDGEWGHSRPYFSIATQPKEKFSKERVDYYRRYSGGRAIAYYMDGYMTALLDGHHKAFAAAMNHQMVNALVIMPGYLSRHIGEKTGEFDDYLQFGDISVSCKEFNLESSIVAPLEKVSELQMKAIEQKIQKCSLDYKFPINIEPLISYYPTVEELADIDRAGNITDELLDKLLQKEIIYTENEVCILMKALNGLKHKRLREMGEYFSSQPYHSSTLYTILKTMMKLPRDDELELFFIDKMVELEEDYPEIKKMILDFL